MTKKRTLVLLLGFCWPLSAPKIIAAEFTTHPEVKFDYVYEIVHDDGGLEAEPKTQIYQQIKDLRIDLRGKATPDRVSYRFRLRPLNRKVNSNNRIDVADYAWLKWQAQEKITFLAGLQKARIYGWDRRQDHPIQAFSAMIKNHLPFGKLPLFELVLSYFGDLTLQFPEDYRETSDSDPRGYVSWNDGDQKQPAILLEWKGDFNGIMPLIQYAQYDLNHSKTFTLGFRYKSEKTNIMFDYVEDSRSTLEILQEVKNLFQGISLTLENDFTGYKASLHFSGYEKKPAESATGRNSTGKFDSNGSQISLALYCNALGKGYQPYLAFVRSVGKFSDIDDPSKESELVKNEIKFGVGGTF